MSAPTAPSRSITPGQMLYAVHSWDGDGVDVTLYGSLRSATYGASNIALDICESNDPELFAELEKISDPKEIITLFTESVTEEQGLGGVTILSTLAPRV